jgi:hypothetical protein
MKYLKIKSAGIIEEGAFSLLGASTKKDDDSKIGMFGSGLKYSIAALLRNNVLFKIFSGEEEIKITTKETKFRDKTYDLIVVNGQETSLTTTMGDEDWDTGFSFIREIYSNALDEDSDTELSIESELNPVSNYTVFYIQLTKDVKDFYDNIHNYFCKHNSNVIYADNNGAIYPSGGGLRLFRKGILCSHQKDTKALFNYNGDYPINESRVLKTDWDGKYKTGLLWMSCTSEEAVNTLLKGLHGGNAGYYEHNLIFSTFENFSEAWASVCKSNKFIGVEHLEFFKDHEKAGRLSLPFSLLKRLMTQFPDMDILGISKSEKFKIEKDPNSILVDKVLDALNILYSSRYKERFKSKPIIKYYKFEEPHIRAEACDGEIHLSYNLDSLSVDEIAKILIEENEHNLTNLSDETRGFQSHLFDLYYDELTKNVKELV